MYRKLLCLALLLVLAGQAPSADLPMIDPKADAILKQMCTMLSSAKEFSLETSSLVDEVTPTGQKIQYSKHAMLSARRPDALRAVVKGDRENYTAVYDGKAVYFQDPNRSEYATAPMPPTIDAALDALAEKYGIVAPLADLLFSHPYEAFMSRLAAGTYVAEHWVGDTACHHLAFRGQAVDWQIWIEKGDKPVPRKLVITYKMIPGEPQFIALLDKWDFAPKLAADTFKFTAPAGAKRVELTPIPRPTTQQAP